MRLDPALHFWMKAPASRRIFQALEAVQPDCVRFVGGCVRNALLGAPVDDLDLATQLEPPQTLKALEAAEIKAIPTGIDHGTIAAVVSGQPFEITSLRRDVATDGRRAVVAFTQDWQEDAQRRDFYLNALYCDAMGQIYDPLGGLDDALAGRIRFIGDADERIREDYLRILRFYRFHAWYGTGDLDPIGQVACEKGAKGVSQLSPERIWKEIKKLLSADNPSTALIGLHKTAILESILTPALDFKALFGIIKNDVRIGASPDPLLRLMALVRGPHLGDGWDAVNAIEQAFKPSKAERARIQAGLSPVVWSWGISKAVLHRQAYHQGAQAICDQIRLDALQHEDEADWGEAMVDDLTRWQRPECPLTGRDLIAAGFKPGAALGQVLKAVEARWIASDFTLSRDELLVVARQMEIQS